MNPKELVEIYGVEPKKSLGQNFLHDPNALDKIVATAGITPEDAVLEVGPGTGALTTRLAQVAKRLVTVEVDDRLAPILESQLAPYPHIEIIWQDILQVDVAALFAPGPYVVVANLPYYITSAIHHQCHPAAPAGKSASSTPPGAHGADGSGRADRC